MSSTGFLGLNQIVKYGQSHFKKLKQHIGEYKILPNEETLHKIRIELKKLKVLYRLIEYCNEDFKVKKEFKSLYRIFHKAGQIREIDVMERLLINYNIENINGIPSSKEKAKLIHEFNKKIPRFIEDIGKCEKELKKHLSKFDSECYLKYLEKKDKQLKKGLFPIINLKKLHFIRKKIKELVYLNDICNKKELTKLRDLENTIGSWHDKQMVLELLKNITDKSHQILIKKIDTEATNEIKLINKMTASIEE